MPARRLPVTLLALCLPTAALAQGPLVNITPSYGQYSLNDQVNVTIEYCSPTGGGFFDGPPGVTWNGQNAGFSYSAGYSPGCDEYVTMTGTVTIEINGQNVLATGITSVPGGYGSAQAIYEVPQAPTPPTVTPDGEPMFVSPATGVAQRFTIRNNKTYHDGFNLTIACTGVASACTGPTWVGIYPNQTAEVAVTFNVAGALNQTGTVTLTASDGVASDQGSYTVRIAPNDPVIARDQCLTIAVGSNAAFECGDLRIVHPLPSVRTLNTVRTPTLLYNSQQAYPYPILTATATFAPNDRPDSVIAEVFVKTTPSSGWISQCRSAWPGSQWTPTNVTTSRQLVCGFASPVNTGVYPYRFEVSRRTGGGAPVFTKADSGDVIIVDRNQSPFGSGWWLAGFEQLRIGLPFLGSDILWIGGDGSARRYRSMGGGAFVATPVDGPDSLFYNGSTYTRKLKGGGSVVFNSQGQHIRTTNRLGYSTEFTVDPASGRLLAITVPPTGSGLVYEFVYAGQAGTLSRVDAPDTVPPTTDHRYTYIGTSGNLITSILDPSSTASVLFGHTYGIINSRTDRRGAVTTFTRGVAMRLYTSSLTVPGAQPILHTFIPWDTWGMPWFSYGLAHPDSARTLYHGPRQYAAGAGDTANFIVDRFGGVRRVHDPYGNVTTVTRGDPRWPALPTRVQSPNGRVQSATYDQRGNLAATTDSNRYFTGDNPTTRFEWDQQWDQLTLITAPNGQLTRFGVNGSNGNRLHVEDAGGAVRRTTFDYYTSGNGAGMVRAVVAPGGARDSIEYSSLGNVSATRTPLGWRTLHEEDRLGRLRVVRSPLGPTTSSSNYRQDSTAYDARDQVIRTAGYGDSLNGAGDQLLTVRNWYNAEGALDSVERSQAPDPAGIGVQRHRWLRDLANRPVVTIAPDGERDSIWFDAAGNADSVRTRRGHRIRMTYDRLNRLVQRITPEVRYDSVSRGLYDFQDRLFPYPFAPNDAQGGLTLFADTAVFAFDEVGNLIRADNRDARVRRSFYRDGQVRYDSLFIRTLAGTGFTDAHAYGLAYAYDVNGRLATLRHPLQLATGTGVTDTTYYTYDAVTGALATVKDLQRNLFTLGYNNRGELIRRQMPGSVYDTVGYDNDGRLTLDKVINSVTTGTDRFPQTLVRSTRVTYADMMRVDSTLNTAGYGDTTASRYSGLGSLVNHAYRRAVYTLPYGATGTTYSTETHTADPLGNTTVSGSSTNVTSGCCSHTSTPAPVWNVYNAAGRLRRIDYGPSTYRVDSLIYNAAGDLEFRYTRSLGQIAWAENRASYVDAEGRIRAEEYRGADTHYADMMPTETGTWEIVFDEHRYDALGRRVLTHTRRACWVQNSEYYQWPCGLEEVRRAVWAGDQLAWEIRMPDLAAYRESDDATVNLPRVQNLVSGGGHFDPNPWFGRVGYTHGPGLDRPFSVTRFGYRHDPYGYSPSEALGPFTVVPHWNWRGQADYGLFSDGRHRICTSSAWTEPRCVRTWWRHRAFGVNQESAVKTDTFWGYSMVWLGSLVENGENPTGTLYRRNRHLDPTTGQFTQEDPIGLAGGLNLYGFGAGDPVNLGDPFGLCPEHAGGDGRTPTADDCPREVLDRWASEHITLGPGASLDDLDSDLRDAVIKMSITLNLDIYVSSTRNGRHSATSAHYETPGGAIDISRIYNERGEEQRMVELSDADAEWYGSLIGSWTLSYMPEDRWRELIRPFSAVRFHRGPWSAVDAAALIAGHRNHVHISILP